MAGVSRFGLGYGDFSIGASFRSSSKDLDPQKGTTNYFDVQLGYHNRKWGLDTYYQTYQGFYTANTNLIQLFPDLKFRHYGLMGRYALTDSDFSVGALMDQSDEVKNSAGKIYLIGGLQQHEMDSPTSLLIQENAGINSDLEKLRKLKVSSLNLGLGAGRYWVNDNHFFIGAMLDVMGTLGLYTYENDSQVKEESSYATLSPDIKLGLGYAGQTYKFGLSAVADITTLRTPGSAFIKPASQKLLLYMRIML